MEPITIPDYEIQFSYSRSSGPGGQNVNKVSSRVTLRWNIFKTTVVHNQWRQRIVEKFHNRINDEGEFVIHSDKFRDQKRNQQDCIDKLLELIEQVRTPPKKRVPTKPSKAKNQKRLTKKREQSDKKRTRKRVQMD